MTSVNANLKAVALASMVSVGLGLGGCASTTHEAPEMGEKLVWTSNGEQERPNWALTAEVDEQDDGGARFVGISDRHSTQRGARDAALSDARRNITQYVKTEVETQMESEEVSQNLRDKIENAEITTERVTREVSAHAVREMEQVEWRYEQWGDPEEGETYFMAFTLVEVGDESLEPETVLDGDDDAGEEQKE